MEQGFYSPNDSSKYHTTIRNFQKQTRKTPESKENNEVGVHGSDKGRHWITAKYFKKMVLLRDAEASNDD